MEFKDLQEIRENIADTKQKIIDAINKINLIRAQRNIVEVPKEPESIQETVLDQPVIEDKKVENVQSEVSLEKVKEPEKIEEVKKPTTTIYIRNDQNNGFNRNQNNSQKTSDSRQNRTWDKKDLNKKPFNTNGQKDKVGFIKTPPTVIDTPKADTRKTKVNKDVEKTKTGLSKRDQLKRGYDYDRSLEDDGDGVVRIRGVKKDKQKQQTQVTQYKEITEAVVNSDTFPIRTLCEKIGKPANEVVSKLFQLGKMLTINSMISFEEAELIAMDYGITLTLKAESSAEDKLTEIIKSNTANNADSLVKRPPVVTIMGHVDHGKTSLLDYIRKTNVIATEAGGITQHIGAYTIDVNGEKITFLDTPGHEAFTAMRRRGAQVTDIAVIVIAADDTIMPQTIEAINHAKEAGVKIIIAANKIDKTNGDYSKLLQQLPNYELLPEEWGGDTMVFPISAKFGQGIDELLEGILLQAEMLELKASKKCPASGSIIEARLDKNIGPVATVLVQNGTLKVKDYIVAGTIIGKVRAMTDYNGKQVKEATPSYAVQVQGFQAVPNAGDQFVVVKDDKLAKQVAEERADRERSMMSMKSDARSLEDMFKNQTSSDIKILPIIIKTDVQGSCEAVKQAMQKLSDERAVDNLKIKIIHAGVGAINESDVTLADISNAIILGFNVRPESKAKSQAETNKIDIRTYSIIYDAIDDINAALDGMLDPKFKETALGTVEIRQLFKITGVGMIAGCYVLDGKIQRNCGYRLLRDNIVIHSGKITSLKHEKDDVKEMNVGYECGVGLDNFNDFKVGDILETYLVEKE